MSIRKATLNLLQRSIEAYKQLEGEGTDLDVLFRGFSGRPVFLEREQQKYRNELKGIISKWMAELNRKGPEALAGMLIVLELRVQNAAERHIPKAYKLGVGDRKLTQDDQDKIQVALDSNRVFLQTSLLPSIDNRIRRAEEGMIGEEPPPFGSALRGALPFSENRAGLYAGLFWTAVWIGFGAALVKQFGSQAKTAIPVRRLLDPRSKHCGTCPGKAGEYSSWDEMLAFTGGLPADGSDQCHCITSGESRILTRRGNISIADVVIGDEVLTHRGRWRRVLNAILSFSGPKHRQAQIFSPSGAWIGCTSDHRWLTPEGWITALELADTQLQMYNIVYAEKLLILREKDADRSKVGYLPHLCSSMQVRELQGSSCYSMQVLRDVFESQKAMDESGFQKENSGRATKCGFAASEDFRQTNGKVILSQKIRWQNLCFVLGEQQEALHLPIPVEVDQEVWSNSRWVGFASHQSQCVGRPPRELRTHGQLRTHQASFTRSCGHETPGDGTETKSSTNSHMPILSKEFHQEATEKSTIQILLGEMLPLGTPLYDLTVEEDHSFIVEGLISHNSNCNCSLQVFISGEWVYTV